MSGKKAFWDTNLFIYLIEENEKYLSAVHNLLSFLDRNEYEVITSTLTVGEILTKPYKDMRLDLVKEYQGFFYDIELVPLVDTVAELFARIRADYSFKPPDAIQLASAVYARADLFISNDAALKRFKHPDCRVALLGDFD